MTEEVQEDHHLDAEPLRPPLPPDLADFLRDKTFACLFQASDRGTVVVIKALAHEIESAQGRIPVQLRHELYEHPAAPVIRTVITLYDQPTTPLALETFTNVADPQQRADFAALATQEELLVLFYDEALGHRLTKSVRIQDDEVITQIVEAADSLLSAIPAEQFDFDQAKSQIMKRTKL